MKTQKMGNARMRLMQLCLWAGLCFLAGCRHNFDPLEVDDTLPDHLRAPWEEFPSPGSLALGPNFMLAQSMMSRYDSIFDSRYNLHMDALLAYKFEQMKYRGRRREYWEGEVTFSSQSGTYDLRTESYEHSLVFFIRQQGDPGYPQAPSLVYEYGHLELYPIRGLQNTYADISYNVFGQGFDCHMDVTATEGLFFDRVTGTYTHDVDIRTSDGEWISISWNSVTREGRITRNSTCPSGCCWDSMFQDAPCP